MKAQWDLKSQLLCQTGAPGPGGVDEEVAGDEPAGGPDRRDDGPGALESTGLGLGPELHARFRRLSEVVQGGEEGSSFPSPGQWRTPEMTVWSRQGSTWRHSCPPEEHGGLSQGPEGLADWLCRLVLRLILQDYHAAGWLAEYSMASPRWANSASVSRARA